MKKIMVNEIFQLIIEADQKLKKAVLSKDNKLINQAKEMLKQARSGAQVIGNNALSEQAGRRLADLEALKKGKETLSTRAASEQPPELGDNSIHVLEGATFMLSDQMGDVPDKAVAGLFHEDTRFLSKYELFINGKKPQILTSNQVDYYTAGFFMTNPELEKVPAQMLSIQRARFVGDGMHDDLVIYSHLNKPVEVEVRLSFGVDFADIFEVKQKGFRKHGQYKKSHNASQCRLRFDYQHQNFKVSSIIEFTQAGRIEGDDVIFEIKLPPRESWKTCIIIKLYKNEKERIPVSEYDSFVQTNKQANKVLQKWEDAVPRVESGKQLLKDVYEKSIIDLAALRLYTEVKGNEISLPAAGLPWFMAIFGRDTLITSYQSLWLSPELAKGTLCTLAALQGTEKNDFRDEQPGKILHEIRFGELTILGEKPHHPYYGTADATVLWLILLSEYWRFSADNQTVDKLRNNAIQALEWIDRYGDHDGDGYVEYKTRSSQGLDNQCWKDSWDSIRFANGNLAQAPLATCEIQGYVYDAKLRIAELAEIVWQDKELAVRLRKEAEELFIRFNRDFWIESRGGYYALALDNDKQKVDALTSNIGLLLWSGIVPENRSKTIVKQLFSDALFSGWGVRTMSRDDKAFNPIGYHTGTVWPHDNALITAGLIRYGFREEANRIITAMFEAASFTNNRLPEVFAGYPRSYTRFPVRYPTACSPQAWATTAPFLWLRLLLSFNAKEGKIVCEPNVPVEFGEISIHGLHAFGKRFDINCKETEGQVSAGY